jgi:uncharacterized membrane protein
MNTVFKFYFQVWVLWGISAAVLWPGLSGRSRLPRLVWFAGFVALFAASLSYPLLATPARWRDRFDTGVGFTLDGQAYMRTATHTEMQASFPLAPDLDAIRWLQATVEGTPVIVEAQTPEYRWGARISTNTGLPTILGWAWHETQQRAVLPPATIARRAADVAAIYTNTDMDAVGRILDRYHAEYIYLGALERIYYPGPGLEKFDADGPRWRQVYSRGGVRILRVVR